MTSHAAEKSAEKIEHFTAPIETTDTTAVDAEFIKEIVDLKQLGMLQKLTPEDAAGPYHRLLEILARTLLDIRFNGPELVSPEFTAGSDGMETLMHNYLPEFYRLEAEDLLNPALRDMGEMDAVPRKIK